MHKAIELANQNLKYEFENSKIDTESPLDQIMTIYLDFTSPFTTPKDVANGLDILKMDMNEKKLNALTRKYFLIRRRKIESLISLAQKKGELSSKLDVSDLVWNLESLWQGSIMLWALIGSGQLNSWVKKRLHSYLMEKC